MAIDNPQESQAAHTTDQTLLHSGHLGLKRPVREFDTPLSEAIDQGPISPTPDTISHVANLESLSDARSNKAWYCKPLAIAAGAATLLGVGAGVGVLSSDGDGETVKAVDRAPTKPHRNTTESNAEELALASELDASPKSIFGELILKRHIGICNADAQVLRDTYNSPNNTRLIADLEYIADNPDLTCTTTAAIGGEPVNVVRTQTSNGVASLSGDYPYTDELGASKWLHADLLYSGGNWQYVTIAEIADPTIHQ